MEITWLFWCLGDLCWMHSCIRNNNFSALIQVWLCFVFQLAEAVDKTFESLNQPADYKELQGKDPPTVELLNKIEQVNKKNTVQAGFLRW